MQLETIGKWMQKLSVLLFSFLDDIAVFVLSRMGFHWMWLRWFGTVLLVTTLSYWIFRLLRYCYHQQILL